MQERQERERLEKEAQEAEQRRLEEEKWVITWTFPQDSQNRHNYVTLVFQVC